MPDIQEGAGVEEAPAAKEVLGYIPLEVAPPNSLQSLCSRMVAPGKSGT